MMLRCYVFYDGKTQTGASGRLGTAFIHPVKPFKHPFLICFWNPDSRILHGQTDFVPLR